MIVKPAINFLNTDNDPTLIKDVKAIVVATGLSPYFVTPDPTLAEITAAVDAMSLAMANANDGGTVLTAIKDDKRAILVKLVRFLAGYVFRISDGNMTALLTSGFKPQKPFHTKMGIPATPDDLTVSLGDLSGELDAGISRIEGVAIYNWQIFAANAPLVLVQAGQSPGTKFTFKGLTPGIIYNTQVNAVGTAGASDWSNVVARMVV